MSDSPRKRYIRLVRHSTLHTLQQKAGFLVLLVATAALAASLVAARDRLAKRPGPASPVAGVETSGLGEE